MFETLKKNSNRLRKTVAGLVANVAVCTALSLTLIPTDSANAAVRWSNSTVSSHDPARAAVNFWRGLHHWYPAQGWHEMYYTAYVWNWDTKGGHYMPVTRASWRYHGGQYYDRDRQLRNWLVQQHFGGNGGGNPGGGNTQPRGGNPAQGMWFQEYDITYYNYANHRRDARRIVREMTTGFTFVTNDHYSNFECIGRQ